MADIARKCVLVVCSLDGGRINAISQAMKYAQRIRESGHIPIVRYLDKDFQHSDPQSLKEMREFEMAAIRRKFVDEIEFVDIEAADVATIVELARQYGYLKPVAA